MKLKNVDTNMASLLRQVADELEEQNDPNALSLMSRARLKRLTDDLREDRDLRSIDARTDRVKEFLDGSYTD